MTATPPSWRVGVRRGDVVSISATYDSRRSSWYESMGIMPVALPASGTGPDPFATNVDVPGELAHRSPARQPQPRRRLRRPARRAAAALHAAARRAPWRSATSSTARATSASPAGTPADGPPGQSLRFVNRDAKRDIVHSITSCRAPCNAPRDRLPARRTARCASTRRPRLRTGERNGEPPAGSAWRPERCPPARTRTSPRAPVHARRVPRQALRGSFDAGVRQLRHQGVAGGCGGARRVRRASAINWYRAAVQGPLLAGRPWTLLRCRR